MPRRAGNCGTEERPAERQNETVRRFHGSAGIRNRPPNGIAQDTRRTPRYPGKAAGIPVAMKETRGLCA
jgi:hypothetical protein